jgi:acetylornithine deacetylase
MTYPYQELAIEALGLLRELISIPSVSREEAQAADHLQRYLELKGVQTGRKGNNVWALSPAFSPDKPTLLLNSHIDTVKPVAGWRRNPFTPTDEGERLYGLGSNDAGASLVTLLHVFLSLCKSSQPYNIIFLASCEEEVSGSGGIQTALEELPPITFALVGEPTDMQPAIAEKGLMVLDVTAVGKAGHAAREEGINAIYGAMHDIEWFRDYRFPKVSPLLGAVKMSVTQINAGTQHNVVPDRCSLVVDVRTNECYTNEEVYDIVRRHILSSVTARSYRLQPSSVSPQHPLVKRLIQMGRTPFGSPTLSDQSLISCPSMKLGPGSSSRSHTADEYVLAAELQEAVRIYLDLLDGAETL